MTPTDIQNKRFDKAMSGYRMEEVQAYLDEVAAHVRQLTEQNDDLQRKLEILAEKVEQYREDEDSLRAALIGAQKLGDSVVRESKRKAEAIIAQAARKAEGMVSDAQASIDKESMALTKIQKEVSKFKQQIITMYKEHLELIDRIPDDEEDLPQLERAEIQYVAGTGELAAVNAEELPAEDEAYADQPPEGQISFEAVPEEEEEENPDAVGVENPDAFPRRKSSRFGTLQFGEGYDLTRKE